MACCRNLSRLVAMSGKERQARRNDEGSCVLRAATTWDVSDRTLELAMDYRMCLFHDLMYAPEGRMRSCGVLIVGGGRLIGGLGSRSSEPFSAPSGGRQFGLCVSRYR